MSFVFDLFLSFYDLVFVLNCVCPPNFIYSFRKRIAYAYHFNGERFKLYSGANNAGGGLVFMSTVDLA